MQRFFSTIISRLLLLKPNSVLCNRPLRAWIGWGPCKNVNCITVVDPCQDRFLFPNVPYQYQRNQVSTRKSYWKCVQFKWISRILTNFTFEFIKFSCQLSFEQFFLISGHYVNSRASYSSSSSRIPENYRPDSRLDFRLVVGIMVVCPLYTLPRGRGPHGPWIKRAFHQTPIAAFSLCPNFKKSPDKTWLLGCNITIFWKCFESLRNFLWNPINYF